MRIGPCTLALAVLGLVSAPGPASAQPYSERDRGARIDVGFFYDNLAPYGDWIETRDHGWSWAPHVERGWRPYTHGQWILTDDGWFWDSDEPFGWATFHYGRWVNDRDYGWFWVPGTEWAPAWVSWRQGNGYTGWAPLPPRARWQTRIGLSLGGLEIDALIGSHDYAFVPDRSFVDRGLYQRVLSPTHNLTILGSTRNVTHYSYANQRVFNRGVDVAGVERAVGRRLQRSRTIDLERADGPRRAQSGEVSAFRPEVRSGARSRPARGRSLVAGDAPPARLMERRRAREQDQRRQNVPEQSAGEVAQRSPRQDRPRPAAVEPQREDREPRARTPEAEARQPRDTQQQKAERRVDDQQPATRQRDERQGARQDRTRERDGEEQQAKQGREAAREAAQEQRTGAQERQRAERDQQRDAQQATKERDERQAARQDQARQRDAEAQQAKQERQAGREAAQQQRAGAQEERRADREKARDDAAGAREAQQQERQQARQAAAEASSKARDKDKGKRKGRNAPEPTPTPESR